MMQQQPTPDSDDSSSESPTQLSHLPPPLLVRTLQLVLQADRLSRCALVQRAWHAAAAQASTQVRCALSMYKPGATRESVQARAAAFAAWLEQHGQRVESLAVHSSDVISLSLPWDRLSKMQSLHLDSVRLPVFRGGSSSAGATAAGSAQQVGNGSTHTASGQVSNTSPPLLLLLPRLKQLHLFQCRFDSADTLVQLFSSSPGLTSLKVGESYSESVNEDEQQHYEAAICALLQHLPHLVALELPFLPNRAAEHMARIHSLQDVQLIVDFAHLQSGGGDAADRLFAALPSSVTRLQLQEHLEMWQRPEYILPSQLSQLTNLRQFGLRSCAVVPSLLSSVPQLTYVKLTMCFLLPADAGSLCSTASVGALLGSLQQLTQLKHLELNMLELGTAKPPAHLWSALTAPPQLTYLGLSNIESPPLPQNAGQAVFPAGRRLPQLQVLSLHNMAIDGSQAGWCLDGQDLHSLVSCCPGLKQLVLKNVVREGADLCALLQLPASLSSLVIGGPAFTDTTAPLLLPLTQLTDLSWHDSPAFSPVALEQLTALQRLSKLDVECHGDDMASIRKAAGLTDNGYNNSLWLKASDDKGPVWKQLQAVCDLARAQEQQEEEEEQQQQA